MKDSDLDDAVELQEDGDQDSGPVADSSADQLRVLEAILFASDELLTATRLKTILPGNPDARQIRKMVDKINVQLQKERHPFEIVEIGGGYQFRTVAYYHPWVRQIFKDKAAKKLSFQGLECLAIIAYKQPISKAEIEAIRGVLSDGAMKTLLEKRLVTIAGRSEKPGRPLLYGTSQDFLKYFGLNKIADLPRIEEFEALAREKMEELSVEELQNQETPEGGATEDGEAIVSQEPQPVSDGTALFEVTVEATAPEVGSEDATGSEDDVQEETPGTDDEADFEPKEPVVDLQEKSIFGEDDDDDDDDDDEAAFEIAARPDESADADGFDEASEPVAGEAPVIDETDDVVDFEVEAQPLVDAGALDKDSESADDEESSGEKTEPDDVVDFEVAAPAVLDKSSGSDADDFAGDGISDETEFGDRDVFKSEHAETIDSTGSGSEEEFLEVAIPSEGQSGGSSEENDSSDEPTAEKNDSEDTDDEAEFLIKDEPEKK